MEQGTQNSYLDKVSFKLVYGYRYGFWIPNPNPNPIFFEFSRITNIELVKDQMRK